MHDEEANVHIMLKCRFTVLLCYQSISVCCFDSLITHYQVHFTYECKNLDCMQ